MNKVPNLSEDEIRRSSPDKRRWIVVVGFEILLDGSFQFVDGAKGAAAQPLLGDFGEPTLDLVEPQTTDRSEVEMIARSALEPRGHLRRLVGVMVVEHQMHFEVCRHRVVDVLEKTQKLLVAVARVCSGGLR